MHIISVKRLRDFWQEHAEAEVSLRPWYKVASKARWQNISDVRRTFPHADSVNVASGTAMTVFNVGGNNFRVIARIFYEFGRVYVREVLTHAEYSKGFWKDQL